jgi:hypothetical protein
MMFIVRANDHWRACWPPDATAQIKLVRQTPGIVATEPGQTDLFCVGDEEQLNWFRERGWNVVALRDGWYADDGEGGVAIWGQGLYWEVRDTPFSVKEAVGPAGAVTSDDDGGETLDVRKGIFGT